MSNFDSFYHDPMKDKEKAEREIISISLNREERLELDIFKKRVGIDSDSQALKSGMIIAQNVLHSFLGDRIGFNLLKIKRSDQRFIQEKKKKRNTE